MVFYINISVRMIVALPTIMLPYSFLLGVLRRYAGSTLWFLRVICGIGVEWRGREKLPQGACIVACKHQSVWETFALFMVLPDPTYVLKRELMQLPLFGWLATKARMIPIDRGSHAKALTGMLAAARREAARGRQIVIFPEGTRRPPGAKPHYLPGAAFLYLWLCWRLTDATCCSRTRRTAVRTWYSTSLSRYLTRTEVRPRARISDSP